MSAPSAQKVETMRVSPGTAAQLDAVHAKADNLSLTPGWIPRERPILRSDPNPQFVPAHWNFDAAAALLDATGPLLDLSLAERRNFVLRNPAPGTNFETARTLVCAYQMILPGEIAPSHRHSSHALRVVVDGEGSYSTVDGQKIPMETGDVILTPGWCWHGHGHEGERAAYWFDGLDVPLTQLLEPMFYQEHPERFQTVQRVALSSPFRFARDVIARRLDAAMADPEGFYGQRIELEAPDIPSMGLHVERIEGGVSTRRHRSTANIVLLVLEGSGVTNIGRSRFTWRKGDVLVAPTWTALEHIVERDAVLFTLSDEPLMRWLRYFRFEAA